MGIVYAPLTFVYAPMSMGRIQMDEGSIYTLISPLDGTLLKFYIVESFTTIVESFRIESFVTLTESFMTLTESFVTLTESFITLTESFVTITESSITLAESFVTFVESSMTPNSTTYSTAYVACLLTMTSSVSSPMIGLRQRHTDCLIHPHITGLPS